jgi:hypothetical protein
MFREGPEDEDSPRFFSACGRDVHCAEDELHYNPQHRRLTLTGDGSRKQAKLVRMQAGVMKAVKAAPGLNGTQVEAALREDGVTFQKGQERKALNSLVKKGLLKSEPGPKNSKLYFPTIPSPPSPHEEAGSSVSPTTFREGRQLLPASRESDSAMPSHRGDSTEKEP